MIEFSTCLLVQLSIGMFIQNIFQIFYKELKDRPIYYGYDVIEKLV